MFMTAISELRFVALAASTYFPEGVDHIHFAYSAYTVHEK